MKNFFSFSILFVLLVSNVNAFDCSKVSNYDSCLQIEQTSLNQSDKDLLIANIDYTSKSYPDHAFILEKNSLISVTSPPNGIIPQNGVYVKDAWVSLLTIMPSVVYNDSIYVNDSASVYSTYNYWISVPANYQARYYPYTNGGDCKTTYQLTQDSPVNNVYVNNILQGSGKIVNINVNSDSEIKSVFSVSVGIKVSHYKWNRNCHTCSYFCEYRSYDIKSENFILSDSINVKHKESSLFSDITAIDKYYSTTKVKVNYSGSILLNISQSSFTNTKYVYDVFFNKEPYYFFNLRARDNDFEESKNLYKSEDYLIVKNTSSCSVEVFDFFNTIQRTCDLGFNPINLTISTDKERYNPNETIQINLSPSNIPVIISYANESKLAVGTAYFIADKSSNRIKAESNGVVSEKVVYVNQTELALLLNLSVFSGLNYFFFATVRKFWGGIL